MSKRRGLSEKLVIMGVSIGILIPLLGGFAFYESKKVAALNNRISDVKLAKTKELGGLVFKFRDIRLQFRTVPVRGMTWENIDKYLDLTKQAVGTFLEAKKSYASQIEDDEERALFSEFEKATQEFMEFGTNMIALTSAHDLTKLDEVARQVRDVCPVKADKVEKAIAGLISQQTLEAKQLVDATHAAEAQTTWTIIIVSVIGFVLAVLSGVLVARVISRELQELADELAKSSSEVTGAAQQVSENGTALSASVTQQSETLQETVSAIEEISSMVTKNSHNAQKSKESAASSLAIANDGKSQVDDLINEVQEIQRSTGDLMHTVEAGNQEINKVVNVIAEIEAKTKVINDIVFQTKLLSFNASVEAARAGESGKGFAVVAEEVGNLAAMSGRSAKEISDLLSSSVQMVQNIISANQANVQRQADESKKRVEYGIQMGRRCGESLGRILDGAQHLDSMVSEIAAASSEQSTGVSEVTRAMNQMDQVTQANANVSHSSAAAASQLNAQAIHMKVLVDRLYVTIRGSNGVTVTQASFQDTVHELPKPKRGRNLAA